MGMGSFDVKGLKELQKQLEETQKNADAFVESCAKELAARLLRMVVKRTPVGDYSYEVEVVAKRDSKNHKKGDVYKKRVNKSGKHGGTLRRGWISETQEEAEKGKGSPQVKEMLEYINGVQVTHSGGMFRIEITNPVAYAPYVEYGHRTVSHKGWVKGRFMMTVSEQDLQTIAPRILEKRLKDFLGGTLK
nr:HK97 gp10 family phage protein [uncultured Acetatifactor sp.]